MLILGSFTTSRGFIVKFNIPLNFLLMTAVTYITKDAVTYILFFVIYHSSFNVHYALLCCYCFDSVSIVQA